MAKSRPLKGTELTGRRILVPGAEYSVPQGTLANEIGQPAGVYAAGQDADYDSIILKPIDAESVTTNLYGEPTYAMRLGWINSHFTTRGIVFPGGDMYENTTQWEVPAPYNMDTTNPQVVVRLHVLIPATLYTRARMSAGSLARAVLSKV